MRYICRVPEEIVFHALVNGFPVQDIETEGIITIYFRNSEEGSPGYSVAGSDMTLYIGSTREGRDIAEFRIRDLGTYGAAAIQVNETAESDVGAIVDGLYLSIALVFKPARKLPRFDPTRDGEGHITNLTEYHDYDINYTGSYNDWMWPKANITDANGNAIKLADFTDEGQDYRTQTFSAHTSWSPNIGGTIAGWQWGIQGATIIAGGTDEESITVRINKTTPFQYIYLLIWDNNSFPHWIQIPFWVIDRNSPPEWSYNPESPMTSNFHILDDKKIRGSGRYQTIMFFGDDNEFDISKLPDRSILYIWDDTEDPCAAHYCIMYEEDPSFDIDGTTHTVKVKTLSMLMEDLQGTPFLLEDPGESSDFWHQMQYIDLGKFILYTIKEYTTIGELVNIYPPDAYERSIGEKTSEVDIWTQMAEVAPGYSCIVSAESSGSIFVLREYSLMSLDDRTLRIPVKTYTEEDLVGPNIFTRNRKLLPKYAWVQIKGSPFALPKPWVYGGIAPGLAFSQGKGSQEMPLQRLPTVNPQERMNELVGLWYGWKSNPIVGNSIHPISEVDEFEPAWERPILLTYTQSNVRGLQLLAEECIVIEMSIHYRNDLDEEAPAKDIVYTVDRATWHDKGVTVIFDENDLDGSIVPEVPDLVAAYSYVTDDLEVTFTDESEGTPLLWLWNFGDGFKSILQNPVHTFTQGTHRVKLTVRDIYGNISSIVHTITILAPYDVTYDTTDILVWLNNKPDQGEFILGTGFVSTSWITNTGFYVTGIILEGLLPEIPFGYTMVDITFHCIYERGRAYSAGSSGWTGAYFTDGFRKKIENMPESSSDYLVHAYVAAADLTSPLYMYINSRFTGYPPITPEGSVVIDWIRVRGVY